MVVGIVFVVYNRQRVFVRDPLGSVTRNGVKEAGAQVFINYNNDALIENDNPPMYTTLVQHGQEIGSPANLKCVHWMMCLTDADVATMSAVAPGAKVDSMTSAAVTFHSAEGRQTVVALR